MGLFADLARQITIARNQTDNTQQLNVRPTQQASTSSVSLVRAELICNNLISSLRKNDVSAHESVFRDFSKQLVEFGHGYDDVRMALKKIYSGSHNAANTVDQILKRLQLQPVTEARQQSIQPTVSHTVSNRSPVETSNRKPLPQTVQRPTQSNQAAKANVQIQQQRPVGPAPPTANSDLYGGSIFFEASQGKSFTVVILGDRKTGKGSVLRGFLRASLVNARVTSRPTLHLLDLHHDRSTIGWGNLENDVEHLDFSKDPLVAATKLCTNIEAVAVEVRKRREANETGNNRLPNYVLAVDGWDMYADFCHQKLAEKSEQATRAKLSQNIDRALHLILRDGPDVGVNAILTARTHDRVLSDRTLLHDTRLIIIGRLTKGYQGGYTALDKLLADKLMIPSSYVRDRFQKLAYQLQNDGTPIIATITGGVRMGVLPDMSPHNKIDLQSQRQQIPQAGWGS